MAERTDLPARRVLIVVSDGAGEYDIKEDKKIDKKLKQVIEAARDARIKIEDMKYEIADFGSTSGTFVNGRKINKLFLKNGDVVKLGNTEMEFTLK